MALISQGSGLRDKIKFWKNIMQLERVGLSIDEESLLKDSIFLENLEHDNAELNKACTLYGSDGYKATFFRASKRYFTAKLELALEKKKKSLKEKEAEVQQSLGNPLAEKGINKKGKQNFSFQYIQKYHQVEENIFRLELEGNGRRAKKREEILKNADILKCTLNFGENRRHFIISISNSIFYFFSKWLQTLKYAHIEQRIPDLSLFFSASSAFIDKKQEIELISSQKLTLGDLLVENNLVEIKYLRILSYKILKGTVTDIFLSEFKRIFTKKYLSLRCQDLIDILQNYRGVFNQFPLVLDTVGLKIPEAAYMTFITMYNRSFLAPIEKFGDSLGIYLRKCVAIALNVFILQTVKLMFNSNISLTLEAVVLIALNISGVIEELRKSEIFKNNTLYQKRILSIQSLRFFKEIVEVFLIDKMDKPAFSSGLTEVEKENIKGRRAKSFFPAGVKIQNIINSIPIMNPSYYSS